MASKYKLKTRDLTAYYECPHCHGRDLKGPIDTAPRSNKITRAWFCRTCWWDTSLILLDQPPARPEK